MGDGDGFAAGINRANSVNPGAALPGQDDISEAFTDRRVRAALAFMESGLASGLSVSVVASRVGLSRSRFEHIFKAQTGGTFREVVRVMRLARARKLLRDPRLRVKEIAAQCGYAATSDLTREFRRQFATTPTRYRRSRSG